MFSKTNHPICIISFFHGLIYKISLTKHKKGNLFFFFLLFFFFYSLVLFLLFFLFPSFNLPFLSSLYLLSVSLDSPPPPVYMYVLSPCLFNRVSIPPSSPRHWPCCLLSRFPPGKEKKERKKREGSNRKDDF